jgi:transposase
LTAEEQKKLERLFEYSPDLKSAYTFREELTSIFEMQLTKQILAWRNTVCQSALTCFDEFLTTLNNWLDKIINYFAGRFSSGFVEGLNNKIKTTKRRCYPGTARHYSPRSGVSWEGKCGILQNTTLFQRLYLDLEAVYYPQAG